MPKYPIESAIDQASSRERVQRGSAMAQTTPQGASLVGTDGNGNPKVRRRWLIGDPWTDDYYYADPTYTNPT